MKLQSIIVPLAAAVVSLAACTKAKVDSTPIVPPIANAIKKDTISGFVKGVLLAGKTYYAKNNVYVKKGDTLLFQEGAKLLFFGIGNSGAGGASYSLYCSGSLITQGTKANPCVLSTSAANPKWPAGYWGGITLDSTATYLNMQWTKVSFTGAADTIFGNQYALSILALGTQRSAKFSGRSTKKVYVENCTFEYGYDDAIRMEGPIQVEIRGNVFRKEGGPDGDGISAKRGVYGDICYNYTWSGANNSIKSDEYTTDATQGTQLNIYNNTIISGGWRKQGEASAGMKLGDFSKIVLYNNLMVNCRNGLRIIKTVDTNYIKGKYDYNYIFVAVDSTLKNEYPSYDWGRGQAHDILSKTAGDKNPLLVKFDPTIDAVAAGGVVGSGIVYTDANDPHLQAGSPAVGAGFTGFQVFNFDASSKWAPGKDIGAFQRDGSGNQVLN